MAAEEIQISIERKRGVALYTQIKDAICEAISRSPDTKRLVLPPQRDLASRLGVSRNTVSMAYAELEREGIVASYVGKGTVVLRGVTEVEDHSRRELLERTIRHSVEESLAMGFTLQDYRECVEHFLKDKEEKFGHLKLIFVECNREQLLYFSEHLLSDPGVSVVPLLLRDIRSKNKDVMAELKDAECVVTSFYHKEELENLLPDKGPPIVGIHLQPEMSTIVQIARIPRSHTLGVVAGSKQFLDEMFRTLEDMELKEDMMEVYHRPEGGEPLRNFVDRMDSLLVSPSRKDEVKKFSKDKPVVEFLFAPDKTSINSIRVALLELRQHGDNGEDLKGD
ncbi:GntR family transcriptional regulator [Anaerohalosphaera lusitana]|nr:GntR family transcriptional regulator [Anaerohalosphaera lusitana]